MINPRQKEQQPGIGFYHERIAGGYEAVLDVRPVELAGELTCVRFGRAHAMLQSVVTTLYPFPGVKRIVPVHLIPNSFTELRNSLEN